MKKEEEEKKGKECERERVRGRVKGQINEWRNKNEVRGILARQWMVAQFMRKRKEKKGEGGSSLSSGGGFISRN